MTIYPKNFSDDTVKVFINRFFKVSDTKPPQSSVSDSRTETDPYVNAFSKDAILKMGKLEPSIGPAEIAVTRQNMWTSVVSRHHIVNKVYVLSPYEIFLQGTVEYGKLDGTSQVMEWASNMIFNKDNKDKGIVLLDFYQVYV